MRNAPFRVVVLTLFPEMFPGPLAHSLTGRGLTNKIWSLEALQIRDFAQDKHHTVDDSPYGGGAGMVMRPDVVHGALQKAFESFENETLPPKIIYLTPRGSTFTQNLLKDWGSENYSGCILLCGRYEGIDERVIEFWKENHGMQEVSLGDYVLTGGELAAMSLIDAWLRFVPGVVQKTASVECDSFSNNLLEHPHYTKPNVWLDREVPPILLSGDHQKIKKWRDDASHALTKERRPDLLQ